jgi:two-component system chemotaxis response regulator CheY
MTLNILIVDDSVIVRSVIKKTLSIAEIPTDNIYEAGDGQQGLDAVSAYEIDLVFADINMPVMSGIEMVDRMAKDGSLKRIPVVVISTEGSKTRIEQLKDAGISAFIRKPFTPEILREVVSKITGVFDD